MNILLITPAGHRSRSGNRATATRWARFLRELGHRVRIARDDDARPADLMLALHAWRSAGAIASFAARRPGRALIVALTGTDVYRFLHSHPGTTLASLEHADALIALHARVADDLPARFADRVHTVLQSATPPPRRLAPLATRFEVCVIGHLRDEKDPLRAARAVRALPETSRLHVVHAGGAHDTGWAAAAEAEAAAKPRFESRGERPRWQVRRLMARARLMVISSVMEGGANVVSEACVAGLPVIASDIPGNVGLLGDDYPGYFAVGDTGSLRARLLEAERDPAYLEALRRHCAGLAPAFTPAAERDALAAVLRAVS